VAIALEHASGKTYSDQIDPAVWWYSGLAGATFVDRARVRFQAGVRGRGQSEKAKAGFLVSDRASKNIEVSVVVPALNEAENLTPLLLEIMQAFAGLACPYEVIFVDDGSDDGSDVLLCALGEEYPVVRVVTHSGNHGQSAGQASGFSAARGAVIITMDADQQNDPSDIPSLLHALGEGVDCVCGVRQVRRDNAIRKISSRVANGFRNWITGDKVADAGCTFRAIRIDALGEVPIFNGMHRFLPTILRIQGFRIVEIPVNHRPRTRGYSKYGIHNRLWRGIRDCFAIRWYRARAIQSDRILNA
jgi:dolichol-phosphate mannosyltransferase